MERQSLNLELIGVMLPAAIDVPGSTEQLPPTLQAQASAAVSSVRRSIVQTSSCSPQENPQC